MKQKKSILICDHAISRDDLPESTPVLPERGEETYFFEALVKEISSPKIAGTFCESCQNSARKSR